MANNSKWMNEKRSTVTITISPSTLEYAAIQKEYEYLTGNINPYENRDRWNEIRERYTKKIVLNDVSLKQAQEFAEPIRIALPDQCVSISAEDNFIGNTTWSDQVEFFFEYQTYTKIGGAIIKKRQAEAAEQGITASWE